MRPDNKSESFTFHRNTNATSSSSSNRLHNCRRKLQDKFENNEGAGNSSNVDDRNDRSVLSVLSLNDTRRVIRTGAEKLSKTFSHVRTTLGSISQKFKISTKRRQILEEGPMTPNCETPQTFSKALLGRTPTKLYSPFAIETPRPQSDDKENQYVFTPEATPEHAKVNTNWMRKRNLLDDIFK